MSPNGEPRRKFFDEVVDATGLSRIIGPAAVARACVRAGLDSSALSRRNLAQVIPHLQMTLEIYLREGVSARMRRVKALAHRAVHPAGDQLLTSSVQHWYVARPSSTVSSGEALR
ncbi:MAG TPA: hypothetical protein VKP30_17665 [Polyangiaceae bacterium]|nr:hypothetical protein [Polyangiaceae bacterium]